MNKATDPQALMENALADALGSECLLDDDTRALYTTDVYGAGVTPAVVVRPDSQQKVADAVRIATAAGWAVTQRGGGMSYTGGYLPTQTNTVMLDLSALNRIISINEEDLVITVEAGVTWQQIWEALTPLGLRLPFFWHLFRQSRHSRWRTVQRRAVYGHGALRQRRRHCCRHGGDRRAGSMYSNRPSGVL